MAKPDPYGDIDFDEVTEATGLAIDEIKCLKVWEVNFSSTHAQTPDII